MHSVRLHCSQFWVDVRVRRFRDRWVASADAPFGPTLGLGLTWQDALDNALKPFRDVRDELLATLTRDVESDRPREPPA